MKNLKKRWSLKGELTTKQLVTLVILIVSFIIILFLIFRLNLGGTTDREICRNSVVLRDKATEFAGPLDCRINYLCISGGGDCQGFSATAKAKVNPENKIEIMKTIADEMSACWWQFGEGKSNYLSISDKNSWGKNSCARCSIVKFDKEILDKNYKITYREFYEYLLSHKKGDKTYFSYLYNSNNINHFQNDISYLKIDIDKNFIVEEGEYAIVTGVKSSAIWGLARDDVFYYPYYLKSDSIVSELKCEEFITKA